VICKEPIYGTAIAAYIKQLYPSIELKDKSECNGELISPYQYITSNNNARN
jgi:hypothetical protein